MFLVHAQFVCNPFFGIDGESCRTVFFIIVTYAVHGDINMTVGTFYDEIIVKLTSVKTERRILKDQPLFDCADDSVFGFVNQGDSTTLDLRITSGESITKVIYDIKQIIRTLSCSIYTGFPF